MCSSSSWENPAPSRRISIRRRYRPGNRSTARSSRAMLSAASLDVALPAGGRSRARRRCCRRRPCSGRTRSRPCRWERRSPCPSRRARSRRPGPESRGEGARQYRRSIDGVCRRLGRQRSSASRGVGLAERTRHRPSVASERVPCCRCPTQLTGWWVPAGSRRARSRTSTTTASTTLGIDKVPSAHAARIVPPTPWPGTRGPGSRPSDRRAIRTWCKPSTAVPSAIRHCRRDLATPSSAPAAANRSAASTSPAGPTARDRTVAASSTNNSPPRRSTQCRACARASSSWRRRYARAASAREATTTMNITATSRIAVSRTVATGSTVLLTGCGGRARRPARHYQIRPSWPWRAARGEG